ncbi:DNA polymerase IV [Thalassotalea castellviae]|uniref:DNA polymerase IV n=1 Tax=Thalassotalea castellviae TaxID=3075612 RepID=A0ABU3A0I2_9GAMM|nr:DNA polymerase IV [Thalassotalea sp. W431]MDT0603682.1 DNA polymerase IV [Thalassotalea sp. W431]
MTKQRKIIHVDMDCFYAAVEMRDNPAYKNIPIAIGGNSARGVLCTCNYIAREYGVRAAMPNHQAKKLCPDLLIVNARMAVYKMVSTQIRDIFQRYTELIEPLSLDEAYLDVTNTIHFNGSATLIAEQIRKDIYNELNLTASAGVAPNKFLAKIASDENKPNGQCVIPPEQVADFVADLPLKKIPGVGPKTALRLAEQGFESCRDIRNSSIINLQNIVGKQAISLYHRSFGRDERLVEPDRERKSLAVEVTLSQNILTFEQVQVVMDGLLDKLKYRLSKCEDKLIVKQGVKLKFADFNQTTVEQRSDEVDVEIFRRLFQRAMLRANNRAIRLVGITLAFSPRKSLESECQQLILPIL